MDLTRWEPFSAVGADAIRCDGMDRVPTARSGMTRPAPARPRRIPEE